LKTLGLQFPVQTLDGQILLPSGTLLDADAIGGLMEQSRSENWPRLPVLEYSTIRKDILYFFTHPPYEIIFSGEKRVNDVLGLMQEVSLPLPLLEILERFREADFYTYRHMLLVFALSALLAREMVEDPEERRHSLRASPTHDVGKIGVPLEVLRKPTTLTPSDRQILRHHVISGFVLAGYYLQDFTLLPVCVARDHHERRDGSGYPLGEAIDDLFLEMVIVADIYDALLSPRPYRPNAYEKRSALEVLTTMAEKGKVRWDVVETLIILNRRRKHPPDGERRVSRERRGAEPAGNSYSLPSRDEERH